MAGKGGHRAGWWLELQTLPQCPIAAACRGLALDRDYMEYMERNRGSRMPMETGILGRNSILG